MKAEKGINIPESVIAILQHGQSGERPTQKFDEANNNICRLKYEFMGKTKQT
jgi:hypothetical protein